MTATPVVGRASSGARVTGPTTGGGGGAGFTDDFELAIQADDTVSGQTDADTYAIALEQGDTVAGQAEAVQLGLPAGNYGDSNTAPSDAPVFTLLVWLGSSATVDGAPANVSNADGQNDGAVCTLQTNALGSNEESINTDIGALIPAAATIASLDYQGWFVSDNNLITSKGELWATSDDASFSDILMFRNQDLNSTVDHSSGSFTFDLYAAGVDTAAKASSLQILHYVNDAVAGVTPHTMTVDAGAVVITGAFT